MQLESLLERSAATSPHKTALVCADRRLTYGQLEQDCNRLAHALQAQGVRRGDRVAVYLDNGAEAVIAVQAILKAGGVFLMINPTSKPEKVAYTLNDSRARALIAPGQKLATLASRWKQLPHLRHVIAVGDLPASATPAAPQLSDWNTLLARHQKAIAPPPKACIDIDLAALIYTSGSTGNPKGVMMTHLNMVSASRSITTYLENVADDVIINVLPLSFDYGLYQMIMAFHVGATLVLEKSFAYPAALLQRIAAERVTGLPIVPTILAILLRMDLSTYDLGSLRYISNTGAALPTEHIARFRKLFPQVRVYSMYGLTECKRVAYLPPDQVDVRPGSVGKAIPNTEVYIIDDQGQRVGPDTVGQLVVRGANVMQGYWERPEETAQMLKPGKLPHEMVLHTGDLFRMDAEGYLYFVGRRDDMIKSRGEKVSPKEVENVLYGLEHVAEAAVIGVDDAVLGQAVKAVLVAAEGAQLSDKQVKAYCKQHLEDFMVPQIVEFVDALPKNPSGKIDKRQLR
jgi:acyl-CoA ligase (AMP-forming) (exosortase A-associated)